ncbi:MAG: DNA-directed RNA polymerase subunit beta', partial [Deltaproteobacteria bacterium]|nr:DNA-directed RNA polymerase subunit beta' [Deltaproteobacteria bacterium]
MQAFEPILIEGKAIQLHPLVCTAFNADFDGDQMAVHVPLSIEAQIEARVLMMSTNNILSPASGDPIIVPSQDIVLGIYYMTRDRLFSKGDGMAFSNPGEVRMAYDAGELDLHTSIKVRMDDKIVDTTTGRVLLYEILPENLPFSLINKVMNKTELRKLINECYRREGIKATVILSDRLKDMGYKYATMSGISISINDMTIPTDKDRIIQKAEQEIKKIDDQYKSGLITDGEKYNKAVDIWTQSTEKIASEMMNEMGVEEIEGPEGQKAKVDSFNSIYMMSDSGSRGSKDQMRQLAGMRGLMAKPSGEIIETPITSNFREGLTVLQYFISTHGARKGLADTALKTANSGYLTRRLVDVSQDAVITEEECGSVDGIWVSSLMEGGEIIQRVGDRVLGRVVLQNVYDPITGDLLVPANEIIDEEKVQKIENAGLEKVKIRSVLTCQTKRGICKKCYGRDLAHGHEVNIGEAIGIIAAQSIGEPGTQLTMRTFHIGGTASKKVEQTTVQSRNKGKVGFQNLKTVKNVEGHYVAMNRNGEIAILGKGGREIERYPIIYGAILKVKDGQSIKPNQVLAEWDPFTIPILTEVKGTVKFGDILDGTTMQERRDKVTGKISRVIVETRQVDARPRISIKDTKNKTASLPGTTKGKARYHLPIGAIIMVNEGDQVGAGTVLSKIPRETTKTKDITGGLPRVAELFEVRKPKENAILSEIDGIVSFGQYSKGRRRVVITPEIGDPVDYYITKGKHVSVLEGDYIRAGEPLMDGSANPHDILKIKGAKELSKYLVNEVQEVYRLQGVNINDKHIEVIVRQMLRQVTVKDVGDSNFLLDEHVEKCRFEEENQRLMEQGKKPANAEPLLLGITKASLSTESFISAASFQETTKVLSDASVAGKVDNLKGLKENVIMGRLVPAGTGLKEYRDAEIVGIQ